MLYKTPSAPQRCLNCAEVRSPLTALALAGKLSPALSLHLNAQVRPAQLGCCALRSRLLRSPQPFPRLWSPGSSGLPRSSVAPQTDRARRFCVALYRARGTRPGPRSLTFDLRPPTLRGEQTLQESPTLWIRTPGTANKPPHLPAALPSGRISPRPAQRWRRIIQLRYSIICYIQWGEQVFDTLPILQVFPLTKHVAVCNFYHRYTSTVKDGI